MFLHLDDFIARPVCECNLKYHKTDLQIMIVTVMNFFLNGDLEVFKFFKSSYTSKLSISQFHVFRVKVQPDSPRF